MELLKRESADELSTTIWTPIRMAAFIGIWSLLTPFRIQIVYTYVEELHLNSSRMYIWAGAWGSGSVTPWNQSPLVLDLFYTFAMLPYYSLGLAIAWLVWRWARDGNLTKSQYIERILLLQVAYVIFVWLLFPCPYSSPLSSSWSTCIPTPTSGIVALPFVTKVVKEVSSPW